jgi:PAS domain S-box-containing protein
MARGTMEKAKQRSNGKKVTTEAERLKAILDATPDAIITIDERGSISSFNRSAERLFGYSEAEVIGKNVKTLMPNPNRDAHDGYLEHYARTGEAKIIGKPREVEAQRRDGTTFPVLLWVTEVAVVGARMFLGIVQDIGARKRAEEAREQLLLAVKDTSDQLSTVATQILSATTQQATGAQEQAAAVAQTVSSVEQIFQTSEQAAERARSVAEASKRSAELGEAGQRAVSDSIAGMHEVKQRTELLAESVSSLAEQAQAIGEIIATVNDIAEQTNLLALNASIEAARAGDHGRGFSVVASEVKALAEQSKKATAQVRQILNQIQKATNAAVSSMEEGTRSVTTTMTVVSQAGETIQTLSVNGNEAARAAAQIAASAGQQALGMAQINQAMKNIREVSGSTLEGTRLTENGARDLHLLAEQLRRLLAGYGR